MPQQILYESTNRGLTLERLLRIKDIQRFNPDIKGPFTERIPFIDAVVMGQTPDTGLFVPTEFPQITMDEIAKLKGKPFTAAAYLVFRKFLTEEEISDENLHQLVNEAYDFTYPLAHVTGGPFSKYTRQYFLMHTESPTGDFKNTGSRANARFPRYMGKPRQKYIKVTSSSGDTAGAVGIADLNVEGIISILLYPKGYISTVQEDIIRKTAGVKGGNVYALAVEGAKFSAIQDKMAKAALADQGLRAELSGLGFELTSGNSINWGRILPQIIHAVYSYAQLAEPGEPVIISTPLGNMGHGLSVEMARMMGLPIFSIWPTNENDPFPRYMKSGIYRPLTEEEVVACKSNSMIVSNPSNLARLFHFYGGNVDKDGNVNWYTPEEQFQEMHKHIYSPRVRKHEESQTIADVYNGCRIDPEGSIDVDPSSSYFGKDGRLIIEFHTSCAVHGLRQYFAQNNAPPDILCIAQYTANPYKYYEDIAALIGEEPKRPKAYEWFDGKKRGGTTIPFGYEGFREFILQIAREHRSG